MGKGLSMATRHEITKRYARKYAAAAKKDKGRMLNELVGVTGWSRANARRAIAAASKRRGPTRVGDLTGRIGRVSVGPGSINPSLAKAQIQA